MVIISILSLGISQVYANAYIDEVDTNALPELIGYKIDIGYGPDYVEFPADEPCHVMHGWGLANASTLTWDEIYVVRAGDTLAKIAETMYGDAQEYARIALRNEIPDSGKIEVGQALRIPFTKVVPADRHALGRWFRFPMDKTETPYYKFGSVYAGTSRWAGKPHPGVDFHEYKGANVYAIGEGIVVVNREEFTGYGHYVMIEHTLTTEPCDHDFCLHCSLSFTHTRNPTRFGDTLKSLMG